MVELVAALNGSEERAVVVESDEAEDGEKDLQIFLSQVRTTQMFSSFSEESQHRLTRSLIASKFKESEEGGVGIGGAGKPGAGGGAKKRDTLSKTKEASSVSDIHQLYASPQKMVVRVHGLEGADPRKLSIEGYVK